MSENKIRELTWDAMLAARFQGWRLAPDDATPEMVSAAQKVDWSNEDEEATVHNVWHAMIAAVPSRQPESLNGEEIGELIDALQSAAGPKWGQTGPIRFGKLCEQAALALSSLQQKVEELIAERETRKVIELKMTPISEGLPKRDELHGEQTILTYCEQVGTWDLVFCDAGWPDFDDGFRLGVSHWLDITEMWPGVTAQVAEFSARSIEEFDAAETRLASLSALPKEKAHD
ncbi:hypothetical protein DC522_05705 [Microvirga sp. KLBC 81]|uniref:hypothetical protein n=1 Tax=Microvirga sp. KLBC 81 TaxID=1862707 RepID=UPI000D50F9C9|nr:hypothetical protein [Microvirga sp. KLBC 81]PVE25392.1 hypothetical protein DC522_05705 [Microvirga sp. KLBC 81]